MKTIKVLILLISVGMIFGCATPARVDQMAARPTGVMSASMPEQLHNNIRVTSVIGGDETNPLWTSEISSSDFKSALVESLRSAGLLAELRSGGEYDLEATLLDVEQPLIGLDFTVTTRVRYNLIDRDSRRRLLDTEIVQSHTATFSDAAYGVERLRLANEGAARKNIEELIRQISELQTP